MNLSVKNDTLLKRWKRDVSVILEKTHGNFLVEKLRAMLLIKEDCKALRNINFNGRDGSIVIFFQN